MCVFSPRTLAIIHRQCNQSIIRGVRRRCTCASRRYRSLTLDCCTPTRSAWSRPSEEQKQKERREERQKERRPWKRKRRYVSIFTTNNTHIHIYDTRVTCTAVLVCTSTARRVHNGSLPSLRCLLVFSRLPVFSSLSLSTTHTHTHTTPLFVSPCQTPS